MCCTDRVKKIIIRNHATCMTDKIDLQRTKAVLKSEISEQIRDYNYTTILSLRVHIQIKFEGKHLRKYRTR